VPTNYDAVILNPGMIRQRRLELGFSLQKLAKMSGIGLNRLAAIERGENHPDLLLADLVRLAKALSLTPAELMLAPAPGPPAPDDIKLEAALHHLRLIRRRPTAIAAALGWNREQFAAAAAQLSSRLGATGVVLSRNESGWMLGPRPGILSDSELDRLAEIEEVRDELNLRQARIFKLAIRGELTRTHLQRMTNPADRTALAYLIKHKFIEEHDDGSYRPTIPVAFSLRLIKSLPPGHRRARSNL
jgi:transcriptional regulator with XRE-family HTH domain